MLSILPTCLSTLNEIQQSPPIELPTPLPTGSQTWRTEKEEEKGGRSEQEKGSRTAISKNSS